MTDGADILDALSRPLRALLDPQERIYWLFLVSAVAMPWLLLGLRRGTLALRDGLLDPRLWRSRSSRADVVLLFVKAAISAVLRVPWLAATAGAALGLALRLHEWLGPAPALDWSRPTITVAYSLVLFVAWDLSRFALHLAMHRVPALWALHQVHHSARVLTPLTLYRTHPLESMLYDLRGLLVTAGVTGAFLYLFRGTAQPVELLGVGVLGFAFNLAGANLRHSHVWLRFGRLERWLISPAQHQLHHARTASPATVNLGTWIAAWDRLTGTWRPAPEQAPSAYGLDEANHRYDRVGSLLVGPLVEVGARLRRRLARVLTVVAVLLVPQVASAGPEAGEGAREPDGGDESDADPSEPEAAAAAVDEGSEPAEGEGEDDDVREVVVGSMFTEGEVPRVVGSAQKVSEAELERYEHDDVHQVLTAVPGVYVRGEDGYGLRPNIGLRGANPDRSAKITLLEDGVLLGPAPYSAPAAYYFPLVTRMVGMEVFKGPSSIQHGPNTIGGAINLLTRDIPDEPTAVVDLAGGRFGYAKGHAFFGTTYRGFGVLLEAARVQSNGFKELDTGGDTGFVKNDTMLKLGYETPEGRRVSHDVQLKAGLTTEDSDETYLGLAYDDFADTPYRRYAASDRDNMKWWRSQAELSYLMRQEDTLEVEARAYRHDFHRVWRRLDSFRGGPALFDILAEPNAGQAAVFASVLRGEQDSVLPQQTLLVTNNDRRFVSQGIQSVFRWKPEWGPVRQRLELGGRIHNDSIERHHTEDAFLMVSGTMLPEGTPRQDSVSNLGETVAAAFHLHDAITLWDRVTVAPGVRIELISMRFHDALADERNRRMDTAVTPGVGALVQATPWLAAFGGVHRGFSPAAPGQPEEIRPERSTNYELGLRSLYRGLQAEVAGFASDYGNLIGACTFSSGCVTGDGSQQFNAGAVLVYGLESLARWRHRFDDGFRLELGARYTYTGSRFRHGFDSSFPQWAEVERGDRLPYVPEHVVGGTFAVGGDIWDLAVSPHYNGVMRDVAGQGPIPAGERIPGFMLVDLAAEARVFRRFRVYTSIANLTNNAYIASRRPFGIRPGAPLTFMVGIKSYILP